MKTWKPWPGLDCPDCGSSAEVESNLGFGDGWANDSDCLRCSDPTCPRHTEDLGHVTVYDEDDVSSSFEEWPIGEDDKPYDPRTKP